MSAETERQIAALMKTCNVDRAEALEILEADKAIDHGAKLFELTPEQQKIAKKYTTADQHKKPTAYSFSKRERKENPTKAAIIAEIAKFLAETSENACENVEITNKERQIAFKIGENSYELTLVQKRKPKN